MTASPGVWSRLIARQRRRLRETGREEAGFTLIELLMVAVVLPLIMGAIAAVMIVSFKNTNTTQSRLQDSTNAQVTSANFAQDVAGAHYVTTNAAATSPALCGTGTRLLLGLNRPAVAANAVTGTQPVAGLSVGYWLVTSTSTPEVVRFACTGATTTQVVVSNDVANLTQSAAAISPANFAADAASGWAPVAAISAVTAPTDLSASATLPVVSTAGFVTSTPVSVVTSTGTVKLSCTGQTATSFTGCAENVTGTALPGYGVSQPTSISSVSLSVTEPGTSYTYALVGAPRSFSTAAYSAGGINAPPLLISPANTCSGLSWNGNMSISVNGNIGLNGSVMGPDNQGSCSGGKCKGNATTITSTGFQAIDGSGAFNGCSFSGSNTTTTLQSVIPDPYASVVPTYGSTAFPYFTGAQLYTAAPAGPNCQPGEYVSAAVFQNCTELQPGVYVLDGGWTQTVTLATGSTPGLGVLLYVPCNPPHGSPSNCSGTISGTFNNLPGLSASQAAQSLGSSALQGFAIWQNASDTTPVSLGGNGASTTTGVIYVPGAALSTGGTASFTATRIIASSLSVSGGGHGGGSCNTDLCVTGP
jgi:prepilin-type N-terminal cleavage/methylation domain-containing protein